MNQNDRQNNLMEVIKELQEAATHLRISLERCTVIGLNAKDENALIEFEAFTSRFARAVDLLIHKVYRSIDNVEFVEGGTLIDVMNRAEKRKLIDSAREMRLLKDMRNDIAHEYLAERLQLLHEEVLNQAPRLLQLIEKAIDYCQRLFY
ncbi:MAG: hypothetical protein ACXU9U_01005 [Parachlamydiaceae bacterium]